jgi:pyruvate dehydrogenase E2 component (dihydrolipoamide acetyltransferase)
MASEVKLPELGENLEGGEVLDVKVRPGDTVTEGQTLLELEAEKSTVDVPAPLAGRVTEMRVKKGDHISVGQTIGLIEGRGSDKSDGPKTAPVRVEVEEKKNEAKQDEASHEAAAPRMPADEPRREPVTAASAEPITEANGQQHETVTTAPIHSEKPGVPTGVPDKLIPAGPATRRLARELGIDLRMVQGSALGGRVTMDDVKAYVRQMASGTSGPTVSGPAPPLPDFARWGPIETQTLDPIRRKTAEQMSLAWRLIPQVTHFDEADITDLDAFRRQQEASGPKLTPTAFALKAAASALKQFPQFNASLDFAGGKLILKRYYHIGVAVDTGHGLLVPVLRDVEKKSVRELAQELAQVAERARRRKVPAEEMRGGTFTITNLGGIGGTGFSPIVNYPQVAILGMARARPAPVVRDSQILPRLMLPLAVSYDHRVIDGADAARFTRRITEMLENPLQMLL